MNHSTHVFFQLLRYVLGTGGTLPKLSLDEWERVFRVSSDQTIEGLISLVFNPLWEAKGQAAKAEMASAFLDIKQPQDVALFLEMLANFQGNVIAIVKTNLMVNDRVERTFRFFRGAGIECCLLKGQGNALMYPHPDHRTSGDIDLWVRWGKEVPEEVRKAVARTRGRRQGDESIRELIRFVQRVYPRKHAYYHHVEAPDMRGTAVEMHYRPQFLHCFFYNRRLQKFFFEHADAQFAHVVPFGQGKGIVVPTLDFNVVLQLSHIYKHLLFEGIGLRQIVDFFYLMRALDEDEPREGKKERWTPRLKYLGMRKLCGALMWILEDVLGMDEAWAITAKDEKRGRLVLNEIIQGGNFGQKDRRLFGQEWRKTDEDHEAEADSLAGRFRIRRNLQRFYRDFRMVRAFPSESLSEPAFRFWHAVWCYRHNGKRA